MLFKFFEKQKEEKNKIILIKKIISSLNIPESQKDLYLSSLDILDLEWLDKLYIKLTNFIKEIEHEELKNNSRNNFRQIHGLRKKEANEKQQEINSFSFLLNNI